MKNYLLILVMSMIMTACGNKTTSTANSDTPVDTPPVATAQEESNEGLKVVPTPPKKEPKLMDNAPYVPPASGTVTLEGGRWTLGDRQYEFIQKGSDLIAKMVEVPENSKALPHLNKTQISEVRYDPKINGWRGRYELFEMTGKYVCTLIPQNGALLVTVNTPAGERSGTWTRIEGTKN